MVNHYKMTLSVWLFFYYNKFMKKFPNIIRFSFKRSHIFSKNKFTLNIFEQRYLDLVNDAYNKDKLMGMVQSKKDDSGVYNVGCLGQISDYQKCKD